MSISNVYIWLGKLGILVILYHSHLKEQLFVCGLKKVKEWEIFLVAEKKTDFFSSQRGNDSELHVQMVHQRSVLYSESEYIVTPLLVCF